MIPNRDLDWEEEISKVKPFTEVYFLIKTIII